MELSEDQKNAVKVWIEEGLGAGEIQKKLKEEIGISLTYLDLRLLLDDLKVVPKEQVSDADIPSEMSPPIPSDPAGKSLVPPKAAGQVSVSVDQIARPNAVISGKVTFSDGECAEWQIDMQGRPGIIPSTPGYRPSQKDILAFQMELEKTIGRGQIY